GVGGVEGDGARVDRFRPPRDSHHEVGREQIIALFRNNIGKITATSTFATRGLGEAKNRRYRLRQVLWRPNRGRRDTERALREVLPNPIRLRLRNLPANRDRLPYVRGIGSFLPLESSRCQ